MKAKCDWWEEEDGEIEIPEETGPDPYDDEE